MQVLLAALLRIVVPNCDQDCGDSAPSACRSVDAYSIKQHAAHIIRTIQRLCENNSEVENAISVTALSDDDERDNDDDYYRIRGRRANGATMMHTHRGDEKTAISLFKYILEHAGHIPKVRMYFLSAKQQPGPKRVKSRRYMLDEKVLAEMDFNTASHSFIADSDSDLDLGLDVASNVDSEADAYDSPSHADADADADACSSSESGASAAPTSCGFLHPHGCVDESSSGAAAGRHVGKDAADGPQASGDTPAPAGATAATTTARSTRGGTANSATTSASASVSASVSASSAPLPLVAQLALNAYHVLVKKTMEGLLEALRTIPSNSVQCVLTSPPWNLLGLRTSAGYSAQGRVIYDIWPDNIPEAEYKQWQAAVLNELYRIIKSDGVILYNHRNRHLDHALDSPRDIIKKSRCNVHQEIVLVHPTTVNQGSILSETHEYMYVLTKGAVRPRWDKTGTQGRYSGTDWLLQSSACIKDGIDHPCPFDMRIVEALVRCATRKGDIVLDPFAGSGTTLLVAEQLKRKFIGFDVSDKYRNIWLKRADRQRTRLASSQAVMPTPCTGRRLPPR